MMDNSRRLPASLDKSKCKATINEWSVGEEPDPWQAPELKRKFLQGMAQLPGDTKVKSIRTSFIRAIEGRFVETESGSVYKLGLIDPKYRVWMKKLGIAYNPKQPISFKTRAT